MEAASWLHGDGLIHGVLPRSQGPSVHSSPPPNSKQNTHRQEEAVVCSYVQLETLDAC